MTDENQPREARRSIPERAATGVPGLDAVLQDGMLRGASYLLLGEPGTGKTILGNQFAFNVAANDGVALYVTVLAEAHDRMLMHMARFDFFDPEVVGRGIHYLSLVHQLGET
ncbi:MAG TPA: ATPase domain-containing protein, partial [Thermomicrobiales bacterium]|nr:ATPase domain-containing protein [Thermomicrobiales bacterium]